MAVVIDSELLPAWLELVVRDVEALEGAELTLVVRPAKAERAPRRGRLFRAYEALDRRRSTASPDALTLRAVGRGPAPALEGVDLDVILDLTGRLPGDLAHSARCGIWSLHLGDTRTYPGRPPLFWEVFRGDPVTTTELVATHPGPDGTLVRSVLHRSYAATEGVSLHGNRNPVYWNTARFPARALRSLRERGWESLLERSTVEEACEYDPAVASEPGARVLLRHLGRLAYRRARKWAATRIYTGQWFVAFRRRSTTSDEPLSDFSGMRPVDPPSSRFFADPFLLEHDGRRALFFEDYPLATGKGLISCVELDESGTTTAPHVVLERECHLSYPFTFGWEGKAYMVPETAGAGTVELYRAARFPDSWVRERVLMSGVNALDSTLLHYGNLWWLFAVLPVEGGSDWDELSLFFADSLAGAWTPHPLNPIVSDARRARPAGRILERDGQLLRPGQDCTQRYGRAIALNRIEVLTTEDYHERTVATIEPKWARGIGGTHCYDRDSLYEVVDGCRRVGRGPWARFLPATGRLGGEHDG